MSLKFLAGTLPDSQLQNDFSNLAMLNEEQITELSNLCLQTLSSSDESIQENMRAFGQSNRISSKTLDSLSNSFTYFFAEAVKLSLKPHELRDDLVTLTFQDEIANVVATVYQQHFASLSFAALDATLKVSNLVDMEWKFGVTASSNDLEEAGNCYLQLKLVVEKAGKRDNVIMEMTLEQFYAVLTALQKASTVVERL